FSLPMAAEQAPEPTLSAARQLEVARVDPQNSATLDHDGEEPIGENEEQATVGLLPMLDPAESDHSAPRDSHAGLHLGASEPVQTGPEQGILGLPCPAAEKAQNLKGGGREHRGNGKPAIARFGELRYDPDQDIRIPDGREPRAAWRRHHPHEVASVLVKHR